MRLDERARKGSAQQLMAHGNLLNRKAEEASGQANTEAGFFIEAAQMGHPLRAGGHGHL